MEVRNRKSKCQTCHELEYFQIEMTLGMVRKAASLGCVRCNLLSKSAGLFRNRWPHLEKEEETSVRIIITKSLGQSDLVLTDLQWPSIAGEPEDLAIQITTEVGHFLIKVV